MVSVDSLVLLTFDGAPIYQSISEFPSSWWHQIYNDREIYDSPEFPVNVSSYSSISLFHRRHLFDSHLWQSYLECMIDTLVVDQCNLSTILYHHAKTNFVVIHPTQKMIDVLVGVIPLLSINHHYHSYRSFFLRNNTIPRLNFSDSWSYKEIAPVQKFIQDVRSRFRALYGSYSPKVDDNSFLMLMQDIISTKFKNGVISMGCGFTKEKSMFKNVLFMISYQKNSW